MPRNKSTKCLNESFKRDLRILILLLVISYLLSVIYGFGYNKWFSKELGSKYSCFKYDVFEPCSLSEYTINSLFIFPRHLLFEIPLEIITNLGRLPQILVGTGVTGSIIVAYNFVILIIIIVTIIKRHIIKK